MMHGYTLLYFGLLSATLGILAICAVMLWTQRKQGERSRKFLAWTWMFQFILYVLLLVARYSIYFEPPATIIMPVSMLLSGLWLLTVIMIYPIEVVSPAWLNRKRVALIFSPALFFSVVVLLMTACGAEFRTLHSLGECVRYLSEANVWLRLLLVVVTFTYASLLIFYIPYNKTRNNTTLTWIRVYTLGNLGIAILYTGFVMGGTYLVKSLHALYFIIFIAVSTYQELFVRLFIVPEEKAQESATEEETTGQEINTQLLVGKLEAYMADEKPWLDPNVSRLSLAEAIQSNRTTITRLICLAGYDSFHDYIATYRIAEFCRLVREEEPVNIQETFFNVGFRSKTTAFAQFKKQMKITPNEWVKELRKEA